MIHDDGDVEKLCLTVLKTDQDHQGEMYHDFLESKYGSMTIVNNEVAFGAACWVGGWMHRNRVLDKVL